MNRKLLILVLAGMLLAPIMSVRAFAVRQVEQQAKAADGAVGTQFFKGTFAQALAKAKKENKKLIRVGLKYLKMNIQKEYLGLAV